MASKLDFLKSRLDVIKDDDLYRKMPVGAVKGAHITINGKKLLNLCSNDYLGIRTSGITLNQMQSSSRLVSGNDPLYSILEKKLSRHKSQNNALVFPTGYMANMGAISGIIQKNDLILSDSLNHASIIEACRLSGGKISIYGHNDVDDLNAKLKTRKKRIFIITEGIFSMDGDYAKLQEITEIAQKNNAILILDDAHGDFAVGADGKGTAAHFGVAKKTDIYISSLSKGLGSFGGYVASEKHTIDFLINRSKEFIYTSALPSILIKDAIQRFDHNREKQRKKLKTNTKQFSKGLQNLNYQINSKTHIIPIIIGKEKTAVEFGKNLAKHGIFAQPIRYPTVQKNTARIRLSVTAWMSKGQIDQALDAFEYVGRKFKII